MLKPDINQAQRFIQILRNDVNAELTWQLLSDANDDSGSPVVFHSSLGDALPTLDQYQKQGHGVYVTINETDGKGRKRENITKYSYLFADIDGNVDLNALIPTLPLKPLMVTARDATHGHIYWPIEGIATEEQYNYVQKLIALYLGSDEQVIDIARVARIPGFLHLKDPANPKTYVVAVDNSAEVDGNYTFDEVKQAFILSEEKQKTLEKFVANRVARDSGSGFNDNPTYREKLIHFVKYNAPVVPKGQGRSLNLYRVALFGYDHGVTLEETIDILWEHYNPRCEPPWTDKEYPNFRKYITNAWDHCKNAPGCRTATGIDWGEVPEPPEGWEENAAIKNADDETGEVYTASEDDVAFITPNQAAANRAAFTNKSPIYDLALMYIGDNFPHKTLLRSEKTFYIYNGKHWQDVSDEEMEASVYQFFACWKFPPSKMSNIYKTIVNLCFQKDMKRGVFFGRPELNGTNCIIVRNGIVNIKDDKVVLMPHTRDFFELNALPYDYDPKATCDEFLAFVNSQWPNNQEMLNQLQELYGLCIAQNDKHQKLPVMIGKSRSGKGTHRQVISAMVGSDNICSPSLEALIEDHTVDKLSKSKLCIVPEANNLHHFSKDKVLDRIKAITGGDPVYYNRKFKDGAQVNVWPLMVFQSNEFPDFADPSGALANRIWPFKFTKTFAGVEDTNLGDKLCAPESISGIFNWALQGLARLHRNNNRVTICSESKEVVDNIRYDTFSLSSFVEDFCTLSDDAWVYVEELHEMYLNHARTKNIKVPYSQTKFSKLLDSSHLSVMKMRESSAGAGNKRRYYFKGIKISDIAKQKFKAEFFSQVPPPPPIDINQSIK